MNDIRHIHAFYDREAGVWVAESDDLIGLVSEASTYEGLISRVTAVAAELLAANGARPGRVTLEFIPEHDDATPTTSRLPGFAHTA